ncbi:hypothetical protein Q5M85_23190 [Paraclostridium bifermentans]|nr:hypothetical protein [Paraclostridium bifermentans]
MPAVIKHKDLDELRSIIELDANYLNNHESNWETRIWKRSDILIEKTSNDEEESIDTILSNLDMSENESEFYEDIKYKLDYKYPFMESVNRQELYLLLK